MQSLHPIPEHRQGPSVTYSRAFNFLVAFLLPTAHISTQVNKELGWGCGSVVKILSCHALGPGLNSSAPLKIKSTETVTNNIM